MQYLGSTNIGDTGLKVLLTKAPKQVEELRLGTESATQPTTESVVMD